ncbi:MAG: hypothetical protein IJU44_05515 [Kiritimatiellae bacterium]|nr:hypothetical protein [Kiritimatiellia bacterium]
MNGKLFFICGDDDYLTDRAARDKIDGLIPPEEREWGLEAIDGTVDNAEEAVRAVRSCMESAQSLGLFASRKTTWLRNANFLTGGENKRTAEASDTKEAVSKMAEWLKKGLPEGMNLIITSTKILRTSVFFKTCQKCGEVIDTGTGLKPWELERETAKRLDGLAKEAGVAFAPGAKEEFLKLTGCDTRFIVSELEKLGAYIHPRNRATAADVREVTSIGREVEVWDLTEGFGERNASKALSVLARFNGQKGSGVMLAAMLDKTARELLALREAYDRGWVTANGWRKDLPEETLRLLEMMPANPRTVNDWALKKKLPHARNFTVEELRRARANTLLLREQLVSTQRPEMLLVETALLRCIGRPKKNGRP